MGYALFDLFAVALPAALLLRGGRGTRAMLACGGCLAVIALLWTAPWDDHLVRTSVWAYDPAQVVAKFGAVPAEEYAFVVLQVLLVGAWALRVGALRPAPAAPAHRHRRRRGALSWGAVACVGAALVLAGGHLRYLGLLLAWAAPPLAVQRAVAGDVLAARVATRLRTVVPVALWLCVADRIGLWCGLWTVSAASSSGVTVLGLPIEEGLFFLLTCLLVGDGLLLAADNTVRRRCEVLVVRAVHRRGRVSRVTEPAG